MFGSVEGEGAPHDDLWPGVDCARSRFQLSISSQVNTSAGSQAEHQTTNNIHWFSYREKLHWDPKYDLSPVTRDGILMISIKSTNHQSNHTERQVIKLKHLLLNKNRNRKNVSCSVTK